MNKIIAVMVTWNPDMEIVRGTIKSLQSQIDSLIISDNDSRPEVKEELKKFATEFPGFVDFNWNSTDAGVAAGLNPGVRMAMERGADWVLTLDDDNAPPPGMIKTMLDAYHALSPEDQKKVSTLSPNYTTLRGLAFPDGEPYFTDRGSITSAEMVKMDTYKKIGLYMDELFMDYVDGEFSIRAMKHGLRTLRVPKAVLTHRLGRPITRKFLWKTAVVPNYSPYRYYYMARNSVYLYIRHFGTYIIGNPRWFDAFWAFIIPRYLIKVVLFEDRKWKKLGMAAKGFWDGLRGNMKGIM